MPSYDILHVIPYMHPDAGGPPVVVDRLCRMLVARGWKVHVLTTDALAPPGDGAWTERYRDGYPLSIHPGRGPGAFGYSASLRRAMESLVAESRLVHVHTLWTYPGWQAMRVCRALRVPYLVMPHGMLDPNSLGRKWLKKRLYGAALEWPNLRRAAGMLYTHEEEQRLAEASVRGLPRGWVAPLGSDVPPEAPRHLLAEEFLRTQPELRGHRLVVFLGRLHAKKGLDLLIPAFAQTVACSPDVRLLLIGDGSPSYTRQLRQEVARAGLETAVTFAGMLSGRAKWAALAAASLLALPSYQENFGLVVVEALALGVPVILSRRVNLWRDVVQAGAGFDCDLTPTSLAEAMLGLLNAPDAGEEVGRQGQRLVERQFTWSHHAACVEEAYRLVLDNAPAAVTSSS